MRRMRVFLHGSGTNIEMSSEIGGEDSDKLSISDKSHDALFVGSFGLFFEAKSLQSLF